MTVKILIVDDSKTIRQQVSFTLARSGFTIVEAEDGKDGIAKLSANPDVKLIISDVNMPNMGGLDMIESIKAGGTYSGPIVMLTTEGSPELIARAKAAGAKGWLVKPFKPEQLVGAVNTLVGVAGAA